MPPGAHSTPVGPAVFLAGAQFGQGNLWASIADQLGLESVGTDVLLQAMDAAGEAASTSGSRFVIFIDALNETTPADFWRVHLPALRAAIEQYPHVALAVSCRDTYRELVLEGTEGSHYVRRTHPGFAEREVEATQKYFAHYKLPAPKIPLLTPEFTLPLFLRLYCESLSQPGADPIPDGHQGRVAIFERYLAAKIATIARRFRPDATSSYELNAAKSQVQGVLDGLLDELSRIGRESMGTEAAEAVARTALGDAGADATRILGLLQEEGVLTRERLYLGDDRYGEGVRIVFQAFADFLLLKRRLARSDDPLNDPALKTWLTEECSWGITEAATILFPEVYGVELPDLLGIKLGAEPKHRRRPSSLESAPPGPTALPLTGHELALPRLASNLAADDRSAERCAALHVAARSSTRCCLCWRRSPATALTATDCIAIFSERVCRSATATSDSPPTRSCRTGSAQQPALPAGRRLAHTRRTTPK